MSDLTKETCVACPSGSPKVTQAEIAELMPQVPVWKIIEREGVPRLTREFKFKDFTQALAFTNQIGALAEAGDHHPEILTAWGSVTVTWWTHKIRGLHRNDFVMAAKTDFLTL